jgi:hypothetical protein
VSIGEGGPRVRGRSPCPCAAAGAGVQQHASSRCRRSQSSRRAIACEQLHASSMQSMWAGVRTRAGERERVATGFSLCRSATTMSRRSPCRFSGAFSLSFRSPLRTLCTFFLPYISINDIYRKLKAMKNDSVYLETELWKDQSGSKFATHNQLC